MSDFDFTGMATVYNVLCNDGRVIKQGAFDHQDGQVVPLVWRHDHAKITNVIGHGTLTRSESPPGMRISGKFNTTKEGRQAKQLVDSEDITNLSIWANEIVEHAASGSMAALEVGHRGGYGNDRREVEGGTIREVSLVLSGANPGAFIDDHFRHSDDPLDVDGIVFDGIIIHTNEPIVVAEPEPEPEPEVEEESEPEVEEESEPEAEVTEEEETEEPVLEHADGETVQDILAGLNADQKNLFDVMLMQAMTGETPPDNGDAQEGPTVQEVFDTLDEKQKTTLYFLVGSLNEEEENIQQGDSLMTRNIFEQTDAAPQEDTVLAHAAEINGVLEYAASRKTGTLREYFENANIELAHSITNVDYMFPDAQAVQPGGPELYTRPMEWVEQVLGATKTRPFSRIRSWYADLTPDAARAKGYVTGDQKAEEVVGVLKRVTTPQTIYKLQKLDRDDIIDITDFDVVIWLKAEMRLMLREELARAVLIGDGRLDSDDYKIQETNIRPIYNDNAAYTIQHFYNDVGNEQALSEFTDAELVDLIDDIASSMMDYRGSGQPTFYCQPEVKTRFLLVRDTQGRRLHPTMESLAAALQVAAVKDIPPMAGLGLEDEVDPTGLPAGTYDISTLGVIVNLNDYVIGMDRGGQTSFFDDFDLDYNKYTYLYETRLSGALVHPYSAITINLVTAKSA